MGGTNQGQAGIRTDYEINVQLNEFADKAADCTGMQNRLQNKQISCDNLNCLIGDCWFGSIQQIAETNKQVSRLLGEVSEGLTKTYQALTTAREEYLMAEMDLSKSVGAWFSFNEVVYNEYAVDHNMEHGLLALMMPPVGMTLFPYARLDGKKKVGGTVVSVNRIEINQQGLPVYRETAGLNQTQFETVKPEDLLGSEKLEVYLSADDGVSAGIKTETELMSYNYKLFGTSKKMCNPYNTGGAAFQDNDWSLFQAEGSLSKSREIDGKTVYEMENKIHLFSYEKNAGQVDENGNGYKDSAKFVLGNGELNGSIGGENGPKIDASLSIDKLEAKTETCNNNHIVSQTATVEAGKLSLGDKKMSPISASYEASETYGHDNNLSGELMDYASETKSFLKGVV